MCPNPGEIVEDVIDVVEDIVDTFVDIVETVVDATLDIVNTALSIVGMPFGMAMDDPGMTQVEAQQIQGVLVNKDSAVNQIPIVYGTRRVGGSRIFISTDGDSNKYLYVALVLSEGQVNGYTKLYIDGKLVQTGGAVDRDSDPSMKLYVGAKIGAGLGEFWNGEIDEVRIFSDVRTEAEIRADMFQGGTPIS